ncbi:LANO_0D09604g1_1 [Lachancea nothofagi CBS 11611]|uniref:LANO_0D09604g1_1 n=1 Tax=Lachancea nothofagi CBS 11611 TaxID=1266666 RepID=A0A1G4JJQ2_9SACH|nr:LANO_0D09604g1_1 [Lachancea nothofagi CBS 11611]
MVDLSPILGKHITFPLMCCFSYLLYKELLTIDKPQASVQNVKNKESSKGGDKWKPISLMDKEVEASSDAWDNTKPYPYKPFKAGEYKLNMGVKAIPISDWLVLENTYKQRIEAKWEIIRENYDDVIYFLDPAMINQASGNSAESGDSALNQETLITEQDVENCRRALCELYDHVLGFLLKRFPQYFELLLSPSEESPGVLHNKIMGEFHPVDPRKYLELSKNDLEFVNYTCRDTDVIPANVASTDAKRDHIGYRSLMSCTETKRSHELILSLARLVEEDLLLLLPNSSGQFNEEYILMVGCFAFAAGFNPRERFLKPLTLVHGPVPEYKQKLQTQMNRFFQTHKMGKLVMRLNFSFQTHTQMYVTDDNKGTDDEQISAKSLEDLRGGRDLFYRSERQCLIKLGPQSKAMCFSIKTYLWNMADQFLTDEHYSKNGVLQDMYDAVAGMQENVGQYKRRPEWGPALLTLLQQKLQKA